MSRHAIWMGGCILAGAITAVAQEAPRPSLSRQVSQEVTTAPTYYNLKAGPVLFRLGASMRTEYVDNINLANGTTTPIESDFIFTPQLDLDVNWTFSRLNNLHLHTTFGYTKYLSHPELDSSALLFSPDSILSFNVYAGDFKFTFRDQFSYQEDPIGEGALANVQKYARFNNDAGLDILWDLNAFVLTLGYDHTNLISTSGSKVNGQSTDLGNLDHTVDQVSTSVYVPVSNAAGAGLEATAASIRFPADNRGNYDRYTVGPFAQAQITRYTRFSASGGYQASSFNQQGAGAKGSWYASLTMSNRLNRFIMNEVSVGHQYEPGLFAQQTQTTYANIIFRYQVAPQLAISTTASYAKTDEEGSVTDLLGTLGSLRYQLLTLTASTDYQVTKKLSLSLGYQYTRRTGSGGDAVGSSQDYNQNRVYLVLGYQF